MSAFTNLLTFAVLLIVGIAHAGDPRDNDPVFGDDESDPLVTTIETLAPLNTVVSQYTTPPTVQCGPSEHRLGPDLKNFIAKNIPENLLDLQNRYPERMLKACPNYSNLNESEKRDFWADFIDSITIAEDDANSMKRTRYGKTKPDRSMSASVLKIEKKSKGHYNEGLMQISYTDATNRYQCKRVGLNPDLDENKSLNDPTKTIFNPIINLKCGMLIMSFLVQDNPRGEMISVERLYWSTLEGGRQSPAMIKLLNSTREMCGLPEPKPEHTHHTKHQNKHLKT